MLSGWAVYLLVHGTPRNCRIKVAKFLGELERLVDDALQCVVVADLGGAHTNHRQRGGRRTRGQVRRRQFACQPIPEAKESYGNSTHTSW